MPHLHFLAPRDAAGTIPAALVALAAVCLGPRSSSPPGSMPTQPQPDYIQYKLGRRYRAGHLAERRGSRPDAGDEAVLRQRLCDRPPPPSRPGTTSSSSTTRHHRRSPTDRTASRPTVTVLESTQQGEISGWYGCGSASPRSAPYAHLDLALPGELTGATVNGKPVNVADIPTHRRQPFHAALLRSASRRSAEVDLTLRGDGAITGTLADYSNGLPSSPSRHDCHAPTRRSLSPPRSTSGTRPP